MTKKLLLADDSLTIQKVIGIIFANEDYQLLVTDNGNDALEQARKEIPDLIMADVSMPGKDGFQLCQEIRQTPGLEQVPVMLLPGTFELFDEDRAQSVGANGWLTKPFESKALVDKVQELLAAPPVAAAAPAAETPPVVEETPVVQEPPSVEEAPFLEETSIVEETPAEEAEDDIWGSVSFEDDDLQGAVGDEALTEELASPEAPAPFIDNVVEETPFVEEVGSVEDEGEEVLELADDDVFELEDDAIFIDETPAEAVSATENETAPAMEKISFESPVEINRTDSSAEGAFVIGTPPAEESSFFDESVYAEEPVAEEPPAVIEEPAPLVMEETADVEMPSSPFFDEPVTTEEPPAAVTSVTTDAVEEKLRNLSDEDLQAVVERVAGPLIEKLAGEMLERIAWEVVPDLAENMIREEIRKIKEGTT